MDRKGVSSAQILAIVLNLAKENPQRNGFIDCLNSALRHKGTLPQSKEPKLKKLLNELKKEGVL